MTETPILDERATWKKGFPDLDGDYFSRVDEYDRAPTLIRVESRTSTVQAAVYEFGCGDDLRREYEAEDYEYLGPITPDLVLVMQSQLEQLRAENERVVISMRVACVEKVRQMRTEWQKYEMHAREDPLRNHLLSQWQAANKIIEALESLSIEQPKE